MTTHIAGTTTPQGDPLENAYTRALDVLGGSYARRVARLAGLPVHRAYVWRHRAHVPPEHHPTVEKALRAHLLETWEALVAVERAGGKGGR